MARNQLVAIAVGGVLLAAVVKVAQVNLSGGLNWWIWNSVLDTVFLLSVAVVAVAVVAMTRVIDGIASGRPLPALFVGLGLLVVTGLLSALQANHESLQQAYAPPSLVVSSVQSFLHLTGAFLMALAGWAWLSGRPVHDGVPDQADQVG